MSIDALWYEVFGYVHGISVGYGILELRNFGRRLVSKWCLTPHVAKPIIALCSRKMKLEPHRANIRPRAASFCVQQVLSTSSIHKKSHDHVSSHKRTRWIQSLGNNCSQRKKKTRESWCTHLYTKSFVIIFLSHVRTQWFPKSRS